MHISIFKLKKPPFYLICSQGFDISEINDISDLAKSLENMPSGNGCD